MCVDPLDARRRAEPRAVAAADELRRGAAGAAERGVVGHLRPGHREPEPARVHRHVPRRLSDPGVAELAGGVPAGRLSRARTSTPSTREVEKLIENISNKTPEPHGAAPAARPAAASSTDAPRTARSTTPQLEARIQSLRAGLPHADGGDRRVRHHARARSASESCTATGTQARQMLIARRLSSAACASSRSGTAQGQPWDNHDDLEVNHRKLARECDQPIAALLDGPEAARPARRHAGHLGRRVRPHADRRTADARVERRQDQRPRPQPLRLHDVAGRRRRQGRPRPRRHRRVRLRGRGEPVHVHDLHATHPAPARLRPREASPTATPAATSASPASKARG